MPTSIPLSDPDESSGDDAELLARAVAGERLALECLLVRYQSRILARIKRRLPAAMAALMSPEDVLQESFVDVFRGIQTFRPTGGSSFYRWLLAVSDNRLIDAVRAENALKRRGRVEMQAAGDTRSSMDDLVDLLHVTSRTPSRSAADHEVAAAVQLAMRDLKPEYREALRLRFLEGLSVPDAAAQMGGTDYAIKKLCSGGLQRLREALGDATRFASIG
jgi:RNA polymerase sigma-70 factor (ECF subfamily)